VSLESLSSEEVLLREAVSFRSSFGRFSLRRLFSREDHPVFAALLFAALLRAFKAYQGPGCPPLRSTAGQQASARLGHLHSGH
jgi:hypothetical protein